MKSLRKAPALAVLVGLSQLTCHQVILTAPPGSTQECNVNPEFIAANGDIAVVSVLIFDPTSSPVADGTVVQFLTNLGRIPEQAKTNDGVARVNFISDSRSGRATIRAFSGQGGTSTSTSTTGTTVRAAPPAGSGSEVSGLASGSFASASAALASCSMNVDIGSALPASVFLSANPPRLTGGARTSEISALVRDDKGNPVVNVPVSFRSENPRLGDMDSGGSPRYTNNDGIAVDVFRTRLGPGDGPAEPRIDVFVPKVAVQSIKVFIN